ncbi:hypothetical protein BDP55DRAFT_122293 [Colletotrichum godetiae]|uniref:Uncharacterized protein n=1 Tax=Colletotrichum godetiae TaxID=1209918 RepID=A0AAJ0EZL4_9PEZI|nr:uncharacterized protein BDP55DRAFT_122293 [Colletotrichum godetiae]KAK1700228.1 hypothetical protein BDP55DRAFT_122293 [Colletotrichum godetiae]
MAFRAGRVVNKNPAESPYLSARKKNKGWKRLAWAEKATQGTRGPLCSTQQPPPSRAVPAQHFPFQWAAMAVSRGDSHQKKQQKKSAKPTGPVGNLLCKVHTDTQGRWEGTVIISHGISTFPPSILGSLHPPSMSSPPHPMQSMPLIPSTSIQALDCLDLTQSQSSGTLYFRHSTLVLHDLFACSPRSSSASAVSSTSSRGFQFVHCSRWQGASMVHGP